jgi:hypothetical protein
MTDTISGQTAATLTTDTTEITGQVWDEIGTLDADMSPPVVTGVPQAQGDLLVISWPTDVDTQSRVRACAKATPVGPQGISVVRGQGGNVHLLFDPDGAGVLWASYPDGSQTVGTLVVPPDAVAYLDHAEHGRNAIGPGVYVIRRQREQRDVIALVAD